MKFYSLLFGSDWEESGHASHQHWHQPHYDTLAEQVMANRNEVTTLHNEIQRLSQDLAQSMVLNRALVRLLVSQGVCGTEKLQETLAETLQECYPPLPVDARPSRFCEECGRPHTHVGQKCPYCTEISDLEAQAKLEAESAQEPTEDDSPDSDESVVEKAEEDSADSDSKPKSKGKKKSRSKSDG